MLTAANAKGWPMTMAEAGHLQVTTSSAQVKTHDGWRCDEGYGGTPAVHCLGLRELKDLTRFDPSLEKKYWDKYGICMGKTVKDELEDRKNANVGKSIIGMVSDWVYFIIEHIFVASGICSAVAECHLRRFFTCWSIPGR